MSTAAGSLTYRFWLTGAPGASGDITLTFIPDSWTYTDAPAPTIASQPVTFTPITGGGSVQSTINVTAPNITATGATGSYTPASLDLTTITAFTVTGTNGAIAMCGSQGASASTCVTIVIQAGAAATQTSPGTFSIPIVIETLSGYTGPTTLNVAPLFTAQTVAYFAPAGSAPAAQASSEYGGQLTAANFANQTYVDVQFAPVAGGQLISGSITNNTISLAGAGAAGITGFASGQNPISLGNGVYRFLLQGSFALGQVTVTFAANSFYSTSARGPPCPASTSTTGDCYGNLAASQSFSVIGPTADLVQTAPGTNGSPTTVVSLAGSSIGVDAINAQGYIEVCVHPDLPEPNRPSDDQRQRAPDHQTPPARHPAQRRARPGGHEQHLAVRVQWPARRRHVHRHLPPRLRSPTPAASSTRVRASSSRSSRRPPRFQPTRAAPSRTRPP